MKSSLFDVLCMAQAFRLTLQVLLLGHHSYQCENQKIERPMINVTDNIMLERDELECQYIHTGGPGGQNVNKVSTAAQLRFDVRGT